MEKLRAEASLFQFTPLREGRLGAKSVSSDVHSISIHAPA